MTRLFRLALAGMLALGTLAFAAPGASAYPLFQNPCAGGAASSSAACSSQNTQEQISGSKGLLARITKLVAEVAGIAAVILIIVSGLFFVTAEGDPAKIKSARSTLLGAVIGIVIVMAAQGIITFVLSRIK